MGPKSADSETVAPAPGEPQAAGPAAAPTAPQEAATPVEALAGIVAPPAPSGESEPVQGETPPPTEAPAGGTPLGPPTLPTDEDPEAKLIRLLEGDGIGPELARITAGDYLMLWQLAEGANLIPFLKSRPKVDPQRQAEIQATLEAEGLPTFTAEILTAIHCWTWEAFHGMNHAASGSGLGRKLMARLGMPG